MFHTKPRQEIKDENKKNKVSDS